MKKCVLLQKTHLKTHCGIQKSGRGDLFESFLYPKRDFGFEPV
jgi:hypothetical protein